MELKDTVEMMISDDYKERFRAEYAQTKIRHEKLLKTLADLRAGKLNFELKCPDWILIMQVRDMGHYLNILVERSEIEEIDISDLEQIGE